MITIELPSLQTIMMAAFIALFLSASTLLVLAAHLIGHFRDDRDNRDE